MKPHTADAIDAQKRTLDGLETEKRRLYAEIQSYPTPIAGCDQQFNYLLDELARVNAEVARAQAAIQGPSQPASES